MFCTRARSCARAADAKIVRSRNAQCKTRECNNNNINVLFKTRAAVFYRV